MTSQALLHQEEITQHTVFRALLQATSRPGTLQRLPVAPQATPLFSLLDCLLDPEVSFSLAAPDLQLGDAIRQRWGAAECAVEAAGFFIAPQGRSYGQLERLSRGTPEYPDRGATVIYQVESFAPGGLTPLLSGPGIKDRLRVSIHGLDPAELPLLRLVNSEFPLGVDAILLSPGGELLCIPRSTEIGD
ncbi:phosphonate C-P lyase system protein PhnH [Desulfuromonas carbonis]|uniref:phosphonate C-P lyase system protein PhnH n=1 Tax=Desulfuromonas sp. DDH964 TaxID=1823759 RepID=UPI00078DF7F9|nr:phosphonate C-P lyase system protein PhnH [Desulfuromonas sp. DDH964]AMV73714.1 Alpha-D-ribose 1-methylphosphonate 5-triphosphate synthase subunit PhnH [Desulfuromonas sp. DDH964]